MITTVIALAAAVVDPASKPEPVTAAAATTLVAVTPAATATTQPAADPARRYCVNESLTGSRMAKKICLTKQEWSRRGVSLAD